MVYFDDAERELDAIWLVGDGDEARNISDQDWGWLKALFRKVLSVRRELFWDRDPNRIDPETEIERAINFGGVDYIAEVQRKYGMGKFIAVLMKNRNLSKRAVNYWCLLLGLDRGRTAVFRDTVRIWSPFK